MISTSFISDFAPYAAARLDCREFWAGESWPLAADFADGAGPGLFARAGHSGDVPLPVDGSDLRRLYAMTTFTAADGAQSLVGVGIFTVDLTDWAAANHVDYLTAVQLYSPQALYLFTSADGETWDAQALGNCEQGDGPHAPVNGAAPRTYFDSIAFAWMAAPLRFQEGVNASGERIVFIHTRAHRVEFNGTEASVFPVAAPALDIGTPDTPNVVPGFLHSSARHPAGTDYLLANLAGQMHAKGQSIVYATRGDESGGLILNRLRPRNDDAPASFYNGLPVNGPLTPVDAYTLNPDVTYAENRALGAVNGKWAALFIRDVFADGSGESVPTFWFETFDELPAAVSATSDIQVVGIALGASVEGADLWGLPAPLDNLERYIVQGAGGKAYAFLRPSFDSWFSEVVDTERASAAVFETPCAPRPGDFSNRAAVRVGDLAYIGTGEGYIYLWHATAGTVNVLARVDSAPVVALALDGVAVFALTMNGVWWAADGLRFERLHSAAVGFACSSLAVFAGHLFVVESDGTDSSVTIYDLTPDSPLTVATSAILDSYPGLALTACAPHDGQLWVAADSASGATVRYESDLTANTVDVAALEGEAVTALYADGDELWLGTEGGTLFLYDGLVWFDVAETGRAIHALGKHGDYILIAHADDSGAWHSFKISTEVLQAHDLPQCDRSGMGVDSDCTANSYGFVPDDDVLLILTSCGITGGGGGGGTGEWPPDPGSDPPDPDTGGDPPAPGGIWVSAPYVVESGERADTVLLAPVNADPGADYSGYLAFCRADSEDLPVLALSSYQRIVVNEKARLQRAGRVLRFLVVPPDGVPALNYCPSWAAETE